MTPLPPRVTGFSAPGLFVLLPLVAGILLAQTVPLSPNRLLVGALALTAATGLALVFRCRSGVLLGLTALFLVLGAMSEREEQRRHGALQRQLAAYQDLMETGDAFRLEGVTTSLPAPDVIDGSVEARVDVEAMWTAEGVIPVEWPVRLRLYGETDPERPWRRGDRIRFLARLEPPRGFLDQGVASAAVWSHNQGFALNAVCKSAALLEVVPAAGSTALGRLRGAASRLAHALPLPVPTAWAAQQALDALSAWPAAYRRTLDDLYLRIDALLDAEVGDPDTRDILKALLLGKSLGSPDVKDRWVDAGLYHILVVSGFHLTLIAGFLGGVLGLLRLPRVVHHLLLAAVLRAYVDFVQGGVSVDRAFWVIFLFLLGRIVYREADLLNATALAAVGLLAVNPWNLRDPGFLLTFGAVFALALLSLPVEAALTRPFTLAAGNLFRPEVDLDDSVDHRRGRRWRFALERLHFQLLGALPAEWFARGAQSAARAWRCVCRVFVPTVAVLVFLAPLLAALHLPVSLQGLAATLPALILVWPVMVLLLSLPLAFVLSPGAAPVLVHAAAFLAKGLDDLAAAFAGYPNHLLAPSPVAVAVTIGFLVWALHGRKRRIWAALAATLLFGAYLGRTPQRPPGVFSVTLLDVGEGDAVLLQTPSGRCALLDTGGFRAVVRAKGPPVERADLSRRVLVPALLARGITRLDALVLSHCDSDHAGSAAGLIRTFPVGAVYLSAAEWKTQPETALEIFRSALKRGVPLVLAAAPPPPSVEAGGGENGTEAQGGETVPQTPAGIVREILVDGLRLRLIHPQAGYSDAKSNRLSMVVEADFGGARLLLPGDVDKRVENLLLAEGRINPTVVLKCAHHGSKTSSSGRLLDAAAPRLALLSTGPFRLFSHPSPEVCKALDERGILWWTTRDRGEIVVRFERGGVYPAFPARWALDDEAFRAREGFELASATGEP